MRLIFVPQYPAKLRYQEWWLTEFPKQFENYFDEVFVLGKDYLRLERERSRGDEAMFSPIELAIEFETRLINEYCGMQLRKDDVLFHADLSFPGFFTGALYHNPCPRMYAFCHASARNAYDYWTPVRPNKWRIESEHAKMFDRVFVGSNYHANKLVRRPHRMLNTMVTGLPNPPFHGLPQPKKDLRFVSVSRPSVQKVNVKLENEIEKMFGGITRTPDMHLKSWEEYYHVLGRSKMMLISSKEETWGYQVIDAVLNDVIPIAPNKFSYRELLPREYLYDNLHELVDIIRRVLEYDDIRVPEILAQRRIDTFYKTICHEMIGRRGW